jgi:hypothetical protein
MAEPEPATVQPELIAELELMDEAEPATAEPELLW